MNITQIEFNQQKVNQLIREAPQLALQKHNKNKSVIKQNQIMKKTNECFEQYLHNIGNRNYSTFQPQPKLNKEAIFNKMVSLANKSDLAKRNSILEKQKILEQTELFNQDDDLNIDTDKSFTTNKETPMSNYLLILVIAIQRRNSRTMTIAYKLNQRK